MPQMHIITVQELRRVLPLDLDAVACVEKGFVALASGGVVMPDILRLDIEENHGEVDVKTAYVPGLDSFALKVSPGFFDNPKLGLPSLNGLMVLFSAKTGLVEALLLDNGYLTAVRTAAAGAVAARHLAREDAATAAVLGGGEQARLQLQALNLVRPLDEVRVWTRRSEQADEVARELSKKMDIPVVAVPSAREALAGADMVITSTPATEPVLMADWLEPGQHVTAMGSDAEHKNELEPAVITRADRYVADSMAQVRRLGELHHAIEAGLVSSDAVFPELGAVISGTAQGRTSPQDITVADLTGTGVQDTVIATLARERALIAGAGTEFTT